MIESLEHSEPVTMPTPPSGKLVRSVAAYSFLVVAMLVTPLFVFLPAALFDCAYRNGRRAAWVVLIAAVGVALLAGASIASFVVSVTELVIFVFALALPALAVSPMVMRGESFGRVLATATLLSTIGLFATEGVMQKSVHYSPYGAQLQATRDYNNSMIVKMKGVPAEQLNMLRKGLEINVYCLTGFIIAAFSLFIALSLMLYGRLRAWREFIATRKVNPAAPYLFRNLVLPEWLIVVFLIGGIFPLESGTLKWVSANVLAVVGFLYLMQGLAVFRSMLLSVGASFIGTLFAYAALALLCAVTIGLPLLSITGLFDSFFDFRHFNRKDSSHEGHSD
jgi:hypothetical protein